MKQSMTQPQIRPWWQKQLPMWITMSRMVFTIPCVVTLALYFPLTSMGIFIFSSITDYFDGYFARKWDATTTMGKFMDPIADKILVTSVLIVLVAQGLVDPWSVMILMTRDTLVGGIRAVAAADQIVIAAKTTGKWKTALQMFGIPLIISQDILVPKGGQWGLAILWITVTLSLLSAWEYFFAYKNSKLGLTKTES